MPERNGIRKPKDVPLSARAGDAADAIARSSREDSESLRHIGLAAEVRRNLRAAGYPALHHLEVFAAGGSVMVRGAVPSYFLKQIAQEIAMRTAGVESIGNQVDVRDWPPSRRAAAVGSKRAT